MFLNEKELVIKVLESNIEIDLGGFGKGYALDQMANVLKEWEIDIALLHGGKSTVLALDAPVGFKGWPVTISHPNSPNQILATFELKHQALSGSGLQKGQHIIDPRCGKPVQNTKAAWAATSSAATSDALSTTFMILSSEDVKNYSTKYPDIKAVILDKDENFCRFGF